MENTEIAGLLNDVASLLALKGANEFRVRAREIGCRIAINSDAHAPGGLGTIRYGVSQARRAGFTRTDIVNTKPLDDLLDLLR